MSATHGTSPWPALAGTALLGEVISWNCPRLSVRHLDLIDALRSAGLDESVARELAPRHAFSRACRKLADARIIRQVGEDPRCITFQFTSEHKDGDRFAYDFETLLTLEKATGTVTCPLPGLATLAQEELDRCLAVRTGADVSRIVQRLFERQADLFPIREKGGAYFCPQRHAAFVDQIQQFLGGINGRLARFPVPMGTPEGDRSVQDAVAEGLAALIAAHDQAIAGFGDDTRPDTLARAAERIKATRYKVEAYAEYLADKKGQLERSLTQAAQRLRQRVLELSDQAAAVPA